MSFLNLRKKKIDLPVGRQVEKKEAPKHLAVVPPVVSSIASVVLRSPRITEKALTAQARGVFVFEVAARATKRTVKEAIYALYKVTPRKVAMVTMPKKSVVIKGKAGVSGGGKKAYVYLKKGDKIEIV